MANYKQCKNGHYYDPAIYTDCPYCVGSLDESLPTEILTSPIRPEKELPTQDPVKPNIGENPTERTPIVEKEELVVGWLVAVEGPYRGKSFELYNGYNYVGRVKGDIVLPKDEQMSAEKNIGAVYDDDNNCFYVIAGSSTNVVYFNGKALLFGGNSELNAYDNVRVGKSKFLFVPFCSEHFNWRDSETQKTEDEAKEE